VGKWFSEQLNGDVPVLLPWASVLGFCRIATDARIFASPLPPSEAIDRVNDILAAPQAQIIEPGSKHWSIVSDLILRAQAHAARVTDAHLAALALEHGAILCTSDRGFARFPGLRTFDPAATR
jgi:toxin-antitoxin system PIN domain toxin